MKTHTNHPTELNKSYTDDCLSDKAQQQEVKEQ